MASYNGVVINVEHLARHCVAKSATKKSGFPRSCSTAPLKCFKRQCKNTKGSRNRCYEQLVSNECTRVTRNYSGIKVVLRFVIMRGWVWASQVFSRKELQKTRLLLPSLFLFPAPASVQFVWQGINPYRVHRQQFFPIPCIKLPVILKCGVTIKN